MGTYREPGAHATSTTEAVVAVVATHEPLGCTADEIAQELHLALNGDVLYGDLEDMVARGILERRGVGRGCLYTRGSVAV